MADLEPETLLKKILEERGFPETGNFLTKETLTKVFSVNFVKFLGTPFFTEHLRWLLLLHVDDNLFINFNIEFFKK